MTCAFWDTTQQGLDYHLKEVIPNFIGNHEFHLRANGSNGHYLGDKVSTDVDGWKNGVVCCEGENGERLW